MRYTDRIPMGAPVMVSSSSGVLVGRLNGGDGAVVLTDWMWLRADDDLVDCPGDVIIVRSPDVVILLDEETFGRLTGRA